MELVLISSVQVKADLVILCGEINAHDCFYDHICPANLSICIYVFHEVVVVF